MDSETSSKQNTDQEPGGLLSPSGRRSSCDEFDEVIRLMETMTRAEEQQKFKKEENTSEYHDLCPQNQPHKSEGGAACSRLNLQDCDDNDIEIYDSYDESSSVMTHGFEDNDRSSSNYYGSRRSSAYTDDSRNSSAPEDGRYDYTYGSFMVRPPSSRNSSVDNQSFTSGEYQVWLQNMVASQSSSLQQSNPASHYPSPPPYNSHYHHQARSSPYPHPTTPPHPRTSQYSSPNSETPPPSCPSSRRSSVNRLHQHALVASLRSKPQWQMKSRALKLNS